ncbi:MAG: cytochrome c peroxidase [Pseudomonadota bacterium]
MKHLLQHVGSVWISRILVLTMLATLGYGVFWWRQQTVEAAPWTATERTLIESLWLEQLPPLPNDPGNAIADNLRAANFGQMLFFDTRLSGNGEVSCATCHQPDRRFTDGLPTAKAIGNSRRNTPSLVGVAYSPWLYWDGRKDSLWSQALAPLEDPAEHGGHRMRFAQLLQDDQFYRNEYHALFNGWPEFHVVDSISAKAAPDDWDATWKNLPHEDQQLIAAIFVNLGKVLEAYERRLMPSSSRFDSYVAALAENEPTAETILSKDERAGLRLFIGDARCIQCHNGPLFTNNEFHNTGLLPPSGSLPDEGRSQVLEALTTDVFNCLGDFSDATEEQCSELIYMRKGPELLGAMRTPSLRNLAGTEPYMHKGQMQTLSAVLEHYNRAPLALIGHNEAQPLGLNNRQLHQLQAFLLSLDAPIAGGDKWLRKPSASLTEN